MQEDTQPVAGPSTVPSPRPVAIPGQEHGQGQRRPRRESANSGPQSVPTDRAPSFSGDHRPTASSTTTPLVNSAPNTLRGGGGMDVDQISPASANDRSSSLASSSVPSSSRSSLRTRNVSMTQTQLEPAAGTTASPRIDTTTATGKVGMEVDVEVNGNEDDPASPPAAPPAVQEQHAPQHGHGGGGGKLLKSLVGGIFRRHDSSSHHSDPPPPAPPAPQSTTSASNGNRLVPPAQSPGRRVKSPLLTAFASTQGEPPSMAASVTPRVRNREEATSEC